MLNEKARWICWLIVPGIYCFLFIPWYGAVFVLALPASAVLGGSRLLQRLREERAKRMVRDTEYQDSDESSAEQTRAHREVADEAETAELGELARTVSERQIRKQVLDRETARKEYDEGAQLYAQKAGDGYGAEESPTRKTTARSLANTKTGANAGRLPTAAVNAEGSSTSGRHTPGAETLAQTMKAGPSSGKLGLVSKLFGASTGKLPSQIVQTVPNDAEKPVAQSTSTSSAFSPPGFVSASPSFARVIQSEDPHATASKQPSPAVLARSIGGPKRAADQAPEPPPGVSRPQAASSTPRANRLLQTQTSMANLASASALPRKIDDWDGVDQRKSPEEPEDD